MSHLMASVTHFESQEVGLEQQFSNFLVSGPDHTLKHDRVPVFRWLLSNDNYPFRN